MRKKQTPENIVKAQVKDVLDLMGWFHFPIMQGMGSYPGLPDRIAQKNGITLYIECKAPGGRMSEAQDKFRRDIRVQGGHYAVVDDIDDFMRYLKDF